MSRFDEAMKLLEEKFGNYKDSILALATIALEPSESGKPRPVVRDLDVFYEDGIFYAVTWGLSNKMQEIAQNNEVGFSLNMEWFNGSATAKNLGHALKPENAELRTKLRKCFEVWYDKANNENSEHCVYLAIELTKGVININHFEKLYLMDFVNKTAQVRE